MSLQSTTNTVKKIFHKNSKMAKIEFTIFSNSEDRNSF